jgi:homoaconitase/3-isopropylmalate dehydratase large subunit
LSDAWSEVTTRERSRLVGEFGAAWSRRHAVEHPGVALRATTIDPRMMRCNVNIEIASRFGAAVKRTATGLR